MAGDDTDYSPELLRECPGFARVLAAAAVSGFGSYVTTLAIQVLAPAVSSSRAAPPPRCPGRWSR
ncbi:MAG: hypothetical protein ACR2G2_00725 [Pseudonocardia sp.]